MTMMKSGMGLLPLALALFAPGAHAWFRIACSGQPLVQERVDPIIQPGVTPSNHVHTVQGAGNFAANSTFETLRASQCSTCNVAPEDFTNYWYPKLYFQDPTDGHFEDVGNGGLLIYYQNRGDADVINGGPGLKAFPAGFRMITGDPTRRKKRFAIGEGSQGELGERAVEWACLTGGPDGYNSNNGDGFPHTDCQAGLNARLHFPNCWDGKNADSANHRDHVAYASGLDNGKCPDSHPVGLMHVFYEVTWDVQKFSSRWNPVTQKWPFVYATGDPTGYSWHGDFQSGWDVNALQLAIDDCNHKGTPQEDGKTEACPHLTIQKVPDMDACKVKPVVDEPVSGKLAKLPGCNPLQTADPATFYTDANCPK